MVHTRGMQSFLPSSPPVASDEPEGRDNPMEEKREANPFGGKRKRPGAGPRKAPSASPFPSGASGASRDFRGMKDGMKDSGPGPNRDAPTSTRKRSFPQKRY